MKKIPPVLILFLLLLAQDALAAPKNRLILALSGDPKTFNPLAAKETSTTEVTQHLFNGLTRLNPETGEIEGDLAERWERTEDGLVWTFYLQPRVRWSDGAAFSSKDVVFTFKDLIYNPEIPTGARDVFLIDGKPIAVDAVDEKTVRFTLPSAFAPFLLSMGQPILPEHALKAAVEKKEFLSAWGTNEEPSKITGTGPFILKKYEAGERVELERNEFFWRRDAAGKALPYIDGILMPIIPSADGRLLKFLEGETDAYGLSGRDYPVLAPRAQKKNFTLFDAGPSFNSNFLVFNQNSNNTELRTLFSDKNFRLAVAYALDRESMIDIVSNGSGTAQCGPLSPSIPNFYNKKVTCYYHAPKKSRQILEGMGFGDKNGDGFLELPGGNTLEFTFLTNAETPERMQIAGMIREDLSRIGLKANLLVLDFNQIVSKLVTGGDWEAVLLGLSTGLDPHFGSNVWRSSGDLHFWNKGEGREVAEWERRIDEIFTQAAGEMDRKRRKKLYAEWQQIAQEENPLIYTVLPNVTYAVRGRFESLKPTVLGGPFNRIEELKIKESS